MFIAAFRVMFVEGLFQRARYVRRADSVRPSRLHAALSRETFQRQLSGHVRKTANKVRNFGSWLQWTIRMALLGIIGDYGRDSSIETTRSLQKMDCPSSEQTLPLETLPTANGLSKTEECRGGPEFEMVTQFDLRWFAGCWAASATKRPSRSFPVFRGWPWKWSPSRQTSTSR